MSYDLETWKKHNKCVNYLKKEFYTTDFINMHTRKQLAQILQILEPHTVNQLHECCRHLAFTNMCKKRQRQHIDNWMKLHNVKCERNDVLALPFGKKEFKDYMDRIKNLNDEIDGINDVLRMHESQSTYIPSSLEIELVDVLKRVFKDDNEVSLIDYFIYDLNYGKEWKEDSILINEKPLPLRNSGELYDALLENF